MPPLALLAVLFLGFFVESIVGFGATILAVSLGSNFLAVPELLPSYVPVNMGLSAWVVLTEARHIDRPLLTRRIVPFVGSGTLVGLSLTRFAGRPEPLALFAVFVIVMASLELRKTLRNAVLRPGPRVANAALLLGGVIQGVFGAGGPLIVFAVGQEIQSKRVFRATLALTWLTMNLALMVNFARLGRLGVLSATRSVSFVLPLALAFALGNRVHHAISERRFRVGAAAMMMLAGVLLLLRQLSALT